MKTKLHEIKGETYGEEVLARDDRYFPTFTLSSDDVPELKDFQVNECYCLALEVEAAEMREGSAYSKDDQDKKVTFKIKKVGVVKKDDLEDKYAGMNHQEEYAARFNK